MFSFHYIPAGCKYSYITFTKTQRRACQGSEQSLLVQLCYRFLSIAFLISMEIFYIQQITNLASKKVQVAATLFILYEALLNISLAMLVQLTFVL